MKSSWSCARVFALLWPLAGLMHLLSLGEQGSSPLGMTLWAVAVLAVCFAGKSWALALFCGAQILEVALRMPWVANHWAYFSWVSLVLLVGIGMEGRSEDAWRWPSMEAVLERVRGILVLGVVALYAMALFHKLNADYWNPEYSCALELWESASYFPELSKGSGAAKLLIASTLLLEALIPSLLLFGRTRGAGVLLGAGFHVFLGFVPYETYYNFSILMLALYVAMLSGEGVGRVVERMPRFRHLGGVVTTLFVLASLYLVWDSQDPTMRAEWTYRGVQIFWVLGPLLWIGMMWALVQGGAREELGRALVWAKLRRLEWALLGALAVHAIGPYIGWKSELSFSMYSNLRVRNGQSNHWLVPRTLDLWGWQSDWVGIRDSSSMRLLGVRRRKQEMTWLEFRDHLARDCGVSARFTRKGKKFRRREGDTSPPFSQPLPWWQRKLTRFRPIDQGPGQSCVH